MKVTMSPLNSACKSKPKLKIKLSNLPALELSPDAVKLDTHGVVRVHKDLANEGLKSLMKISKERM